MADKKGNNKPAPKRPPKYNAERKFTGVAVPVRIVPPKKETDGQQQ